ncbi:MAG TPA: hypothetical protein VGQ73_03250 [Gemmatimonadales bacterium]|nr:hypothetical protein [Gemmatimonadales bacterium]
MSDAAAFRQRSAELLLRLYELRREPTLRAARDWWVTQFHPRSAKEVLATWVAPDSGPYRMVTTYWEMAASFVTLGAIDAEMFHAANTEYVAIYAKLEPYLAELRTLTSYPDYLVHLERVVTSAAGIETKQAAIKRFLARRAAEAGA